MRRKDKTFIEYSLRREGHKCNYYQTGWEIVYYQGNRIDFPSIKVKLEIKS